MRVLFLFLDGVGLGIDDPLINPFKSAKTPNLDQLLSGRKLLASNVPFQNSKCSIHGIDPLMGVPGLPQSATSQATLLTGINFSKRLGFHYGPKPNLDISNFFINGEKLNSTDKGEENRKELQSTSIFSKLKYIGKKAGFLNAYPSTYFEGINSKYRNHAVIPLAASTAGITLYNQDDLFMGKALSADFTGQGWHEHLGLPQTPVISPFQAGVKLTSLANNFDFSFFEYWESDYAGHKQDFSRAIQLIEKMDLVIGGLLETWNFKEGMILITSDHGNIEDLSTKNHTYNLVPAFLIGDSIYHELFVQKVKSIGDITPYLMELFLSV